MHESSIPGGGGTTNSSSSGSSSETRVRIETRCFWKVSSCDGCWMASHPLFYFLFFKTRISHQKTNANTIQRACNKQQPQKWIDNRREWTRKAGGEGKKEIKNEEKE
jgi:hypothetical protein